VEAEKVILIYLTVPAIMFIILLIIIELNIFKTAVAIVLAAKAALFERPDKKYEEIK
jgi:cell division protein FtsL